MNVAEDRRILVVGAGPTGLALACELYRHGVPCRIVDKDRGPHLESRATDLQARTLEVFQNMGVLDAMLERGIPRRAIGMFANGQRFARLTMDDVDTPFRFMLGLAQCEIEQVLQARLEQLGGKVERNVRLAALQQHPDAGVTATLLYGNGQWEEPKFGWIIGCDGASSAVRQCLQLSFDGSTFEDSFFLGDAKVDWDLPYDEASMFMSDHGSALALPLPGERSVRLFGELGGDEGVPRDLHGWQKIVDERIGNRARVRELGWVSSFRVHTRMVTEYRRGRVFLAGDAAHIHSPAGGHGMNTGVQDAYNLAWKLALVVQGKGRPELLDSYSSERIPVARAILQETDIETRISLLKNRMAKEMLVQWFSLVSSLAPVRRRFLTSALELAFNYRKSPVVSEHRSSVFGTHLLRDRSTELPSMVDQFDFVSAPRAGDRAPDVKLDFHQAGTLFQLLRGTSHTLLLFDGDSPTVEGYANLARIGREVGERWGDLVRVHVVAPQEQIPRALDWNGSVLLDHNRALHTR